MVLQCAPPWWGQTIKNRFTLTSWKYIYFYILHHPQCCTPQKNPGSIPGKKASTLTALTLVPYDEAYVFFLCPEVCLTSNLHCGVVPSYNDHHFCHWFENNLPFTLAVSTCPFCLFTCLLAIFWIFFFFFADAEMIQVFFSWKWVNGLWIAELIGLWVGRLAWFCFSICLFVYVYVFLLLELLFVDSMLFFTCKLCFVFF